MDADSPEIRRALVDRLSDPEPDPRGEAMVGLATRGDPAVVPAFLKELGQEGLSAINDWVLLKDTATESIRAAEKSRDLRWLPLLKKLKEISFPSDQLESAIGACSTNS